MIAKRSDPWLSATMLVVSVATLGRALQVGDGILKPGTIPWLAIAFLACVAGVLVPLPIGRATYGRAELVGVIVAALAWQVIEMLTRTPFNAAGVASPWFAQFRVGVTGAAMLAGATLLARGWVRHLCFAMLLLGFTMLAASVLRISREPDIDVFVFQRDASDALSRGANPYAITFPDIYGPGSPWYAPGLSVDGRLQFGYPYMPLTLLLAWPGQALAGDYRYALLAAMTASAALVAYAPPRPSVVSFGAAALLLLMPRSIYILDRGWSEPFVVLTLAATAFCATRLPRATPWVLGLYLASKQYVPFGVGAAFLLVREPITVRAISAMLGKALVAAAVVTLPLVLWDVGAFWRSAVALQFNQPFRWDALNFVAWWRGGDRSPLPAPVLAIPFIASIITTVAVLWRCRYTAAGFAAGTALVFLAFFAFNKQAFANYYYFVIGALCCAVANAAPVDQTEP